ncbi:MAG: prepilin peptidase [Chthoniobacterales bacterium]|nr:prepilin peptidase [Chthoniobacterales bacterium]
MPIYLKALIATTLFNAPCALLLGAITGSFLNCLVYRLPRNISLLTPSRSFCPICKRSLPWYENVPLLSWIFLRGRCAGCQAPIAGRYFLVELLTALLFWVCCFRLGFPEIIAGWLFIALLIVATFIDLEWMIIPDLITIGGAASGMISSFLFPSLMGTTSRTTAFLFSLASAVLGYLLLWGVLELGKMAFGRRKASWNQPCSLQFLKKEDRFLLLLEGEELFLEDLLLRPSDKIVFKAEKLQIAEKQFTSVVCEITKCGVTLFQKHKKGSKKGSVPGSRDTGTDPKTNGLAPNMTICRTDPFVPLQAEITELTLPREAMGFGDVKFLACIGAFLGFKGALFSLFAGSLVGAIAGGLLLLITAGRSGRCIPFGPYLALGALIWFFFEPWIFGKILVF